MLGLATKNDVKEQRDRVNSMVALWLALTPKESLNKKIKFSSIPFIEVTIFKNMVPLDEDGERDYNAKVTIRELLERIDP